MDLLSIGVAVASLAGKKVVETIASEAGEDGWGLAGRIITRVRGLFSASENSDGLDLLNSVEEAEEPTESVMVALAAEIASELEGADNAAAKLRDLLDQASVDPLLREIVAGGDNLKERASMVVEQKVSGDDNITIGNARDVNISVGRDEKAERRTGRKALTGGAIGALAAHLLADDDDDE